MAQWRWSPPADESEVAGRITAKRHEMRIIEAIELAAADDNVDFESLSAKIKGKVDSENANKPKKGFFKNR